MSNVHPLRSVRPNTRLMRELRRPDPDFVQVELSRAELLCAELNRDDVRAVIGNHHVDTLIHWVLPNAEVPRTVKAHLATVAPLPQDVTA